MRFFRRSAAVVAVLGAVLALAACAGPDSLSYPTGKTLRITPTVWGYYQEFLGTQGGVRKNGVFLVALQNDVGVGARYSYCPSSADYCTQGGLNVALDLCKKDRLDCVLFARGPKIVVPYEIVD